MNLMEGKGLLYLTKLREGRKSTWRDGEREGGSSSSVNPNDGLILFLSCHTRKRDQTLPSNSEDSEKLPPPCLCCRLVGREWLLRSLPPGLDDAFPYHIIPITAMTMPNTTWRLRPSFPKKKKPITNTRIVFMCPITWKVTALNLPIQMN